jgi:hypothetical protein
LGQYERDLVLSLFQKDFRVINSIPFENRNRMRKIRKELAEVVECTILRHTEKLVLTRCYSEMRLSKYLHIFAKNLFDSMYTTRSYLARGYLQYMDVPDILYHGTDETHWCNIRKEGLDPCKAGQNWTEDKEKAVFLTDSLYASDYYSLFAEQNHNGRPIILRVYIGDLRDKLSVGTEKLRKDNVKAYSVYKEFIVKERISPRNIRNFYLLPENVSLYRIFRDFENHFSELPQEPLFQ